MKTAPARRLARLLGLVPLLWAAAACSSADKTDAAISRNEMPAMTDARDDAPVVDAGADGNTGSAVASDPVDPGSAEAASQLVQRYFTLIDQRAYDQARALWGHDGADSHQSPRQFAASFTQYAHYRAEPGKPGRIDAGAGQRYITVPVHVTGTRKADDAPFDVDGTVTLHRTGDIDGATEAQKRWQIYSVEIPGGATR